MRKGWEENGGYITLFTTLLFLVMLVFVFFMLELVCWRVSGMKASEAANQNIKSLFGDFDSRIYEDYHLLMIDAAYGTDSEVYLEERLAEQLSVNLSGGSNLFRLQLQDLRISKKRGWMESDYAPLKKQIHDYCGYAMTEGLLDMLKRHNEAGENQTEDAELTNNTGALEDITLPNEDVFQDPRSYISSLTGEVLLRFVCPKNKLPSARIINMSEMPSHSQGITEEKSSLPTDFLQEHELDTLLGTGPFQLDSLSCASERLELVFYISSTFHSYVEEKVRVLQAEQEYILYGGESDKENLLSAVNEIIMLRIPLNYLYLRSSISKQAAIQSASAVIAALGKTSPLFMNKVLTGIVCFGESVLDVKALLHGEPVALQKTDATWKLSFSDLFLNKLKEVGKTAAAKGLYYEDYLMLLMLKRLTVKNMYARILDVIAMNVQKERPAFSMANAMTQATVFYQLECSSRFSPIPKELSSEAYLFFFEKSLEY